MNLGPECLKCGLAQDWDHARYGCEKPEFNENGTPTGPFEILIRRHYAQLANEAIERQRRWKGLSDAERHAVTCYAQQFGRKCPHAAPSTEEAL